MLHLQYDFEFIQALTVPDYIKDLVAKKYFEKEAFINYLQYLRYWKEPEYLRLLRVP